MLVVKSLALIDDIMYYLQSLSLTFELFLVASPTADGIKIWEKVLNIFGIIVNAVLLVYIFIFTFVLRKGKWSLLTTLSLSHPLVTGFFFHVYLLSSTYCSVILSFICVRL